MEPVPVTLQILLATFLLVTGRATTPADVAVEAQDCTGVTGPSAPQHLQLTIIILSSSSLTAEWVEPADDGGDAAINYTITLQGGPGATTRTLSSLRTTFTGLEAPNTYTVTVAAVNCAGLSPPATSIISFQAPPPPGGVTTMATSGSSITVTWTPPTLPDNRPPVTGYTVTAVPSSGSTPEELPATSTSTVLSGLQRGTVYTIKVVAHNIIGDSSAATASAQTFARPSQPQHLTITVLSNSSLTAEWVEPADDGGDAAITYTITLQGGPDATTRTVLSLRTTFTGLEAPNSYTVTVAAGNRAGTSPTTEETISFQAPPPPGGLTAMATSDTTVTVTWTPPTLPDNRPPFTGYTVTAVPSSGSTPDELPATATSTVLSGLQRRTVYTIKVVAHNIIGDSSAVTASAQTFAGPSQPQHLTITVLSNSSLTAEWVEPADDGGDAAITYTITLQGGPGATTRTVSSSMTTFTGLEAPNMYTVTVTAGNRAGISPTAEETISFQDPIEPQNVVVTPVFGSELSVSWTAAKQPPNAPPVVYYTVSWKEEGGEGDSHNISGPTSTMYQITGLAQGTQYTVTVTAHNSVGRSDTATGSETTFSVVPRAVSGPNCAALLPAVVALAVALLTVLLLLVAAVFTAILFYTRIRKLSAMLKATQGLHFHYDEVNMEPYSESIIQNFYEAQCEECGEGVTSNDVAMEDNPAHESMNLLQ